MTTFFEKGKSEKLVCENKEKEKQAKKTLKLRDTHGWIGCHFTLGDIFWKLSNIFVFEAFQQQSLPFEEVSQFRKNAFPLTVVPFEMREKYLEDRIVSLGPFPLVTACPIQET